MNRILATCAPCWLLACATSALIAVVAASMNAHAQEAKGAPATKTGSATTSEPATKTEPAAKAEPETKTEPAPTRDFRPPPPGRMGPMVLPPTATEEPAPAGDAEPSHGDAQHDPHDLSHGDGSAQLKAAQELRFDLAIATLIVFLLLAAILAKFAWAPIAAGLDKREQTIAKQIADAEHASAMAAKQLQEYERKLAAATEEARAIVGQARQDAMTAKDKIMAEAQAAAAKERDRAVADINSAKNQALQEIAQKSVSTAISLASNIIRREVKPEDHDKLIHESLQKFSSLN